MACFPFVFVYDFTCLGGFSFPPSQKEQGFLVIYGNKCIFLLICSFSPQVVLQLM